MSHSIFGARHPGWDAGRLTSQKRWQVNSKGSSRNYPKQNRDKRQVTGWDFKSPATSAAGVPTGEGRTEKYLKKYFPKLGTNYKPLGPRSIRIPSRNATEESHQEHRNQMLRPDEEQSQQSKGLRAAG